jgi:hypothetical protein
VDGYVPLVPLVSLPDHHHQSPGWANRPPDVGERGDQVVEEHRAEPANGEVEMLRWKAVHLGIGVLESDVAEPLRLGERAGASIIRAETSTPAEGARASRVVRPVPHPMSRMWT